MNQTPAPNRSQQGPRRNWFVYTGRAWRLRCPRCGKGRLFDGLFTMRPACSECGLDFARGPGFYLGSIYVNYGLTAMLVLGSYLALFISGTLSGVPLLLVELAFSVLFPLWFFRRARAIWLAMDEFLDPDPPAVTPDTKQE